MRLSPEERAMFVREFWPSVLLLVILFAVLFVLFSVVPPVAVQS